MFKIVRNQFSSLVLRIRPFSSNKVSGAPVMEKTKPKLFYKTTPESYLFSQSRKIGGTSSPVITEINYEQLKKCISLNEALIIDVRNKDELAATGVLPNSYNIPLDELSTAFLSSPSVFLEKYNFPKPDKDLSIVFSCAKGIRSFKACQHLADLGYKNLFNYSEGWFGWESHK